ncbi:hypothetical protein [Roseateles saccharophilus]|uniref:Uncharacterized protein n=1 Tax=Roseateles saccharophilus TaxID=304 RepID=A0A4R3ULC1_ROSSA|nr:hypothetical protein [Roseateles saccharophilus]MDG0834178.1 hypothetical protein [Roseateles saccharophilus]TCU91301.1 hypothetical protein EV671_102616 [Roseateles saccharophilus]
MMAGRLIGLQELRARIMARLWLLAYELEERREAAAQNQRNLTCAGYCLLLALCGTFGRR